MFLLRNMVKYRDLRNEEFCIPGCEKPGMAANKKG